MEPGQSTRGVLKICNNYSEAVRVAVDVVGSPADDWFTFSSTSPVIGARSESPCEPTRRRHMAWTTSPSTYTPVTAKGVQFSETETREVEVALSVFPLRTSGFDLPID